MHKTFLLFIRTVTSKLKKGKMTRYICTGLRNNLTYERHIIISGNPYSYSGCYYHYKNNSFF